MYVVHVNYVTAQTYYNPHIRKGYAFVRFECNSVGVDVRTRFCSDDRNIPTVLGCLRRMGVYNIADMYMIRHVGRMSEMGVWGMMRLDNCTW